MTITILTLFPEIFENFLNYSIIKRARDKRLVTINYVNIRDFSENKHKKVDDHPYGGGVGMIMRVDVVEKAIEYAKRSTTNDKRLTTVKVVLLDPQGKTFTQSTAKDYSRLDHLILVCGHYEGIDDRIRSFVDDTISLGDFVLTGGEIPSAAIADATIRLIPGVLSQKEATTDESFTSGMLSYPQYTRPRVYKNRKIPPVLLSGNHQQIAAWRKKQSLAETRRLRPDLLSLRRK